MNCARYLQQFSRSHLSRRVIAKLNCSTPLSQILGGSKVGLGQKGRTFNESVRSSATGTTGCIMWYIDEY